jgi:biotin carboxyl carrier protein
MSPPRDETLTVRDTQGTEYRVTISGGRVTVNDVALKAERLDDMTVRFGSSEPRDGGQPSGARRAVVHAVSSGDTQWVFLDGRVFTFEVERAGSRRKRGAAAGSLAAPMPATVRRIEVAPGQAVRRGDILIVLEAMKMELPVRAPADGKVARVNCREGELVRAGQELVELQPGEGDT